MASWRHDGSSEVGGWLLSSWKQCNKILHCLWQDSFALLHCFSKALIFQSLVILFHFVEEIVTSWADRATRTIRLPFYTTVLFLCLCLVLLPNPWPSRPYNGEQARAFLMVRGAASLDLCKWSCLTLGLCYPLWKKQGLELGARGSIPSAATDACMILNRWPSVAPACLSALL